MEVLEDWPDTHPYMNKIPNGWIESINQMSNKEFNEYLRGTWSSENEILIDLSE